MSNSACVIAPASRSCLNLRSSSATFTGASEAVVVLLTRQELRKFSNFIGGFVVTKSTIPIVVFILTSKKEIEFFNGETVLFPSLLTIVVLFGECFSYPIISSNLKMR